MASRIEKRAARGTWRAASTAQALPYEKTLEVRDRCLCLFVQRAARALARRFDDALRPLRLTHGQFSVLTSLNRPDPPVIGEVALLLGMDRTTLTAALKSLQRRGLVVVRADDNDRRSRRLILTQAGQALLATAYPVWKAAHDDLEATLAAPEPAQLRASLGRIAGKARTIAPGPTPRRPKPRRPHSAEHRWTCI